MKAVLACYAGPDQNRAERMLEYGRSSYRVYAEATGQFVSIYDGLIPLRDIENPLHLYLGIEN